MERPMVQIIEVKLKSYFAFISGLYGLIIPGEGADAVQLSRSLP